MPERIWGALRKNVLYKSTYTLLYFTLPARAGRIVAEAGRSAGLQHVYNHRWRERGGGCVGREYVPPAAEADWPGDDDDGDGLLADHGNSSDYPGSRVCV